MQDKNVIKLTDQDAALLEQGASMLEGLENDERNRGNCSTAEGAGCCAHAVRRLASALLAHEREIGQCMHQIQEPAPVQAAVDTPVAAMASPTFMTADQARDWAWNKVREDVGTEGWTVMDSVNYHGFFLYGWNYRGQYELQRTATRTAVMQEILSAAPAAVAVPDERAAFEKWARSYGTWEVKRDDDSVLGTTGYTDVTLTVAWQAIQARAALAATPAAGELAPLQVGLQEPALVALPEEIPASNTLWMFLTKGMTQSAIAGMPERDRKVLTERAQENWAAIRAEVGATVPVVLPEPVGEAINVFKVREIVEAEWFGKPPTLGTKLYTEQQVRALLAGVSAPAAVAVLDYPWRDRLLDGRELVRDQQGFAEHSELPLLDEGMKPRAFFAALGVEMKHTMADDDLSMDEYDAMSDAENWSAWIPRPPIGDAWNLVAIFDTEDGPAAWWARALKESREASPQAQADARDAAPAASGQDARVQWWLATLDQYGNPTLTDGAHQARAGADKAAYLIDAMNLGRGKKYAVARVELSEPKPSSDGVNHEAIAIHNRSAQAAQQGGE